MKKIFKGIIKFFKVIFKAIWKFIDKIFVTPISKLAYFLIDKTSNTTPTIEKILNKPNALIFVSLVFAFLTFLIFDSKAVRLVETEAVVLTNQSVKAEYNEEAYVIEGIPESVDITLMGRKSDLYLAKQLGEHTVSLDLVGLGVGTHKVKLKYNNPIQTLEYKLDPSTVTVVIYPKVSEARTLQIDTINTDKLDSKLIVSNVTLDRSEVIIKSYKEKLETVASIKALVDVNALDATSAGTYTLENVKLIAYDDAGKEIKGIEVVPAKVTAKIIITSPSKEVPIKVVPVGEVKSGSAIKSITTNVTKLTIYGDEKAMKEIEYVPVEIDVNNLNEDKTYKITLKKPTGVRSMTETNVTVNVTIESQASKEITSVPLEFENLAAGYSALAASQGDAEVTVVVKGVSTLLNTLEKDDIKAYVDLTGYTAGTYDIPVLATGKDLKLTYTSKTKTVKIIIKES